MTITITDETRSKGTDTYHVKAEWVPFSKPNHRRMVAHGSVAPYDLQECVAEILTEYLDDDAVEANLGMDNPNCNPAVRG